MAARKTTPRRKPANKSGRRKPTRQVMEARTKSIAILNRGAFALLMILICVAVGVTVFPQWKELKRLEADLEATRAAEQDTLALEDQKNRELSALRQDLEFQELRGRDLLDLYRPGETIIRIRRD
ncbi:FtsB family cell division protein [Roseibacillus persicicus]|nr:hypothetical protein [Roseibacillus persicicus]MDQ8188723.1 hypothetical protein [Roseibacillus persicicus]